MIPLDFTLTAMRRADVLRRTLESFAANLRGVSLGACTCYLNIDPMPEDGSWKDVYNVAYEHFGGIILNCPEDPNFALAVKWCYAQPRGEYHFALEDDWNLQREIDVSDMLGYLQRDPSLSVVNLRAYNHDDDRICLAPGLWRTEHARILADRLRTDANPERQLRQKSSTNPHGGAHLGFKGKQHPREVVLKDIGRAWMKENGMRRDGDRLFTKWRSVRREAVA